MPSFHSWIYTISVHTGCLIVSAILGTLLYYVVNSGLGRPITKTKDNAAIPEAVKALLCSFVGIAAASSIFAIRPTLEIYSPNDEITWMGPFLASTFGFTTFFKSLNVAFGDYPGSGSDLYTWLLWFSMTPEPTFAKKTNESKPKRSLRQVAGFRGQDNCIIYHPDDLDAIPSTLLPCHDRDTFIFFLAKRGQLHWRWRSWMVFVDPNQWISSLVAFIFVYLFLFGFFHNFKLCHLRWNENGTGVL